MRMLVLGYTGGEMTLEYLHQLYYPCIHFIYWLWSFKSCIMLLKYKVLINNEEQDACSFVLRLEEVVVWFYKAYSCILVRVDYL